MRLQQAQLQAQWLQVSQERKREQQQVAARDAHRQQALFLQQITQQHQAWAALYEVITHSAGNSWMFENRMAHVLAGDYTPLSAVDIFVKDLGLVLDMARASKFPLPLSSTAHQMFMQASTAGFAKEDDSAVIKIFPGIELPKAK